MLPDVAGAELLLIAAVALIVVGPKELPVLLRKVGKAVGRMRAMADEFRASFDEMARQSELDDLRREVEAMRAGRLDPTSASAEAGSFTAGFSDDEFAALSAPATVEPVPEPAAKPAHKAAPKVKKAPASRSAVKPRTSKPPAATTGSKPAAKPNPAARKASTGRARQASKKTPA